MRTLLSLIIGFLMALLGIPTGWIASRIILGVSIDLFPESWILWTFLFCLAFICACAMSFHDPATSAVDWIKFSFYLLLISIALGAVHLQVLRVIAMAIGML